MPLSKFKFVGITENYEVEIERLNKITDLNIIGVKTNFNINPEKKNVKEQYTIPKELKQRLMKLHSKDYELYNEALKIAGY